MRRMNVLLALVLVVSAAAAAGSAAPAPARAEGRGDVQAERAGETSRLAAKETAKDNGRRAKSAARTDPAQETQVWAIGRLDDGYVLRFGPVRAEPVFTATCLPQARLLQVAVEVTSKSIRSGDGVALALSSGKRRLELAASTFRGSAKGRIVAEAAVTLEPRIFDLFRDGDTLQVKLPGKTESYPLAGAKAKLPDFERVCLPRG